MASANIALTSGDRGASRDQVPARLKSRRLRLSAGLRRGGTRRDGGSTDFAAALGLRGLVKNGGALRRSGHGSGPVHGAWG